MSEDFDGPRRTNGKSDANGHRNGNGNGNGHHAGNGKSRTGSLFDALQHWRSKAEQNGARLLARARRDGFDLAYDEELYLRNNEDVAAAVRDGLLRDGYEHWVRFGRQECAAGRRTSCFDATDVGMHPFRVPV